VGQPTSPAAFHLTPPQGVKVVGSRVRSGSRRRWGGAAHFRVRNVVTCLPGRRAAKLLSPLGLP